MFGLLAVFLLVASFVVPANLASPAPVGADPGVCKGDIPSHAKLVEAARIAGLLYAVGHTAPSDTSLMNSI